MAERASGYAPVPNDQFYTPEWVTEALLDVELFGEPIWDPACGEGHIVEVFRKRGFDTIASDITMGRDFLLQLHEAEVIVTNPPYSGGLADKFIRHALSLTKPRTGKVAMLLPITFDSAHGRRDIFADHPAFSAQYVLTRRIRWVNLEQKEAGPSKNHAWYVWDWARGPCSDAKKGYLP